MLDFNTVGIKSTEDLREALMIKHTSRAFAVQVKAMVDRWGLDTALEMLGSALCGTDDPDFPTDPLLGFKEELVIENPNDPWDLGTRRSISKSEVCPACASEWQDGTFYECGDSLVKEVRTLREKLRLVTETLEEYAGRELYVDEGRSTVLVHGVRTIPLYQTETWILGESAKETLTGRFSGGGGNILEDLQIELKNYRDKVAYLEREMEHLKSDGYLCEKTIDLCLNKVKYVRYSVVLKNDDFTKGYIEACQGIEEQIKKLGPE